MCLRRRRRPRHNQQRCFAKSSPKQFGEDFCLYALRVIAQTKILSMEKRLRFPKSRRLTRDSEFRRVRTEGKTMRGDTLTIGFLKNAEGHATVRAGWLTA